MTLSKRQREQLLKKHCGTINSDDAIDPRHYFYNKRKPNRKFRKTYQLCRQVSETLQLVLFDGSELLDGLSIVDVVPAPDSRRMLVIVDVDPSVKIESASHVDEIMSCLKENSPRLRMEISRTINRKKTPNLIFEIARIPPQ